jgi:hypothetical protein
MSITTMAEKGSGDIFPQFFSKIIWQRIIQGIQIKGVISVSGTFRIVLKGARNTSCDAIGAETYTT